MAALHPEMEKHLCAALGVERVGVLLDEDDKNRKWSSLDHDDYELVTAQRDEALAEVEGRQGAFEGSSAGDRVQGQD